MSVLLLLSPSNSIAFIIVRKFPYYSEWVVLLHKPDERALKSEPFMVTILQPAESCVGGELYN